MPAPPLPIPAGLSRRVFTPPPSTLYKRQDLGSERRGDRHLRLLSASSACVSVAHWRSAAATAASASAWPAAAAASELAAFASSARRLSAVVGRRRRLSPRRLESSALAPLARPTRSFSRSAAFRIAAEMALAAGAFGALSDDEDERGSVFGAVVGGLASSSSEPEDEGRLGREQVGGKLELQLEMPADASSALWNLISPCSEPDEAFFEEQQAEEGDDGREGDEHARLETLTVEIPPLIVEDASALADVSDDESEQEMEQVDAESFWAAVERESVWCQSDDDSGDDDSDEEDSSPPAPVPDPVQEAATESNSQKTPAMWTRLKARSYAGASSAGVQAAVASMKQRARTISSVGSRHKMQVDDGDFSSDDEDCQRTSDAPQGKRWRRRRPSMAFAARLSVPTPKMDSLRSASGKFGSKLNLYRSSSSNTVTSEESYLDSPNTTNCETKSAPAAFHIGSKYLPAGKRTESLESKASYSNLHVQRNLRAGVAKAAVYLNSASVEAARKIKAKTTTLRSQWHLEASETEEDEVDTRASSICEAAAAAH